MLTKVDITTLMMVRIQQMSSLIARTVYCAAIIGGGGTEVDHRQQWWRGKNSGNCGQYIDSVVVDSTTVEVAIHVVHCHPT